MPGARGHREPKPHAILGTLAIGPKVKRKLHNRKIRRHNRRRMI